MEIWLQTISKDLERFFGEDDLATNAYYLRQLPSTPVECILKIKSDLMMCGLPYFVSSFNHLGAKLDYHEFKKYEGTFLKKGEAISLHLPFNIALSAERVALNLLSRACGVATFTNAFVQKAQGSGIKILDTRKTTPGLRTLEKYAVRVGGGFNHRFSQTDVWMIKDNHKSFFGGLKEALDFFAHLHTPYQNVVVEIHSLSELALAIDLGVKHVMLDNFSAQDLLVAVKMKIAGMTYEISGGVKLETIDSYLIHGVDYISVGSLTHSAPHVDVSLKIKKNVILPNRDSHEF